MSSNNDNGETMGFAVVVAVMAIIGFMVYAVLAFLAIILTIIAICAWNNPLTLGKTTVQPTDARAFVGRGILGAIGLPVFVGFCQILFDIDIEWEEFGGHVVLGGYVLGSIGLEMMAEEEPATPAFPEFLSPPMTHTIDATPEPARKAAKPEEFRFASWHDEENESSDKGSPCHGCAHYDGLPKRLER